MRRVPVSFLRVSFLLVVVSGMLGLAGCSASTPGEGGPTAETTAGATTTATAADFCTAVESTVEPGNRLAGYFAGEPADDAEIDATVAELRESNAAVVAAAPPEIADDVNTVSDVSGALLDALERTHDPQASLADPAFLFAAARAGDAPSRLSDYARAECGVDLGYLPGG